MKKFIIPVLITCVLSSYSLYIYGKSVYDRYFVTGDINYREQSTIDIVWYLQEKGYTKEDIKRIKPVFYSKQGQYGAVVEFTDKPGIQYTYLTWKNPHSGKAETNLLKE